MGTSVDAISVNSSFGENSSAVIMNGAIIIEGHVQGLSNTRSLGEMGVPVYVIDKTNCISRYSRFCKKFFRCPDFISDDFVPFLIDLAKNEHIKDWILIPSNDHAVLNISKNKTELEKFYKIITPSIDIINQIYDKSNLLALAEKCDVPIPKTQYFSSVNDSISESLTFPLLTKGRNGLSFYKVLGKKAFLAGNEKEFRIQIKHIEEKFPLKNTFTQELIPFNEYYKTISFTAFAVQGEIKTHWIGEKVREHPIQFGTATFARSISCDELIEPSQKLIRELKYTGVCEIEFLLDPRDQKYKLIEINARTWLWVGLAKSCGVDYAKMIYHYVNNKFYDYPTTYKLNQYWINRLTDSAFSILAMLKGQLSILKYFKSVFIKRKTNAFFAINDINPSFAYFLNIISFIKNR